MDRNSLAALQQAANLFAQDDLDGAEVICQKLLIEVPQAVDAQHLLALIKKKQGLSSEAEALFQNCLNLQPGRADIQANLGNLYKSMGNLEQAERQYQKALHHDSSFRPARLGLARLLCEMGEYDAAEQQALALLDKNRADAEAWVNLGVSQRGREHYAEAEEAYLKAIALKPAYGVARHNLGALLIQINRPEDALSQLELAMTHGVTGPEIDFNRASALVGLNQFEDASLVLSKLVTSFPQNIEALELLAKIRYMRGEDDFAQEFADAAKQLPSNIELQIRYARILQGADLYETAEKVLLDALTINPAVPDLYCALAAVRQLAGKYEEALTSAQKAAELEGNVIRSADLVIDAMMALGRAQEALPIIQEARQRSPLNQWYVAMEATAARMLGDSLYENYYNYDDFVQRFELQPPTGWLSMEAFNADLITVLKQRHQFDTRPLDQSLRHGTQTHTSLLTDPDPVLKAFLDCLKKPIAEYRDKLGNDSSHPLLARNKGRDEIIGCWSVLLHQEGYHVNHVHPEGWLSSAYYVATPPEIESGENKAGWIKFGEPRFPVPGVTAEKFIKPKAGTLVLFPSYMWHGTVPIQGDEPRMTIAFDVVTRPD
ncbi:MAG: putative 2OG-Fe(II) oxygenase [Proteobacteria bacterium]|nr:putative 2OG-Fe(II) oxygenase [Pseudomonadota bacterium]